jgi:hypothetical protein
MNKEHLNTTTQFQHHFINIVVRNWLLDSNSPLKFHKNMNMKIRNSMHLFIVTFYCVFTTLNFISTYIPREWTKRRSHKNKLKSTTQEMAPIRHEKEIDINIP